MLGRLETLGVLREFCARTRKVAPERVDSPLEKGTAAYLWSLTQDFLGPLSLGKEQNATPRTMA